jgi:hypothetical protein
LGADLIRDQLIAEIITSDSEIRGISTLTVTANGSTVSDDRTVAARESATAGTISVTVV